MNNPTLRLSNNQIIGFVLITADANPFLVDQSNREGFVESQAAEDLRELLRLVLAEIEKPRHVFRRPPASKSNDDSRRGGLFQNLNLKKLETSLKLSRPNDHQLHQLIEDAGSQLREQVDEVQEVLSRYHRLATLGSLIDTFLHDGRAPLAKLMNEIVLSTRILEKRSLDGASKLASVTKSLSLIQSQSQVLATVFRRLEPFAGRKRGRPTKVLLEDILRDAFAVFETEISEQNVSISLPASKTEVTVDSAEIQEVIINLLQNSLYWLRQNKCADPQILVQVTRTANREIEIVFCDNGPGIENDIRESIFEPYFSSKPDGVGLGLAIAGEIVKDYYDGALELLDTGPLSGAIFRVTLKKRV